MIYQMIIVENLLENTEGGDFFLKDGVLFLAGEDMAVNMRVSDGKVIPFDCDVTGVAAVSGHALRRELGRL